MQVPTKTVRQAIQQTKTVRENGEFRKQTIYPNSQSELAVPIRLSFWILVLMDSHLSRFSLGFGDTTSPFDNSIELVCKNSILAPSSGKTWGFAGICRVFAMREKMEQLD